MEISNYEYKLIAAALFHYERFFERQIKNTYNKDAAKFLKNDLQTAIDLREKIEQTIQYS